MIIVKWKVKKSKYTNNTLYINGKVIKPNEKLHMDNPNCSFCGNEDESLEYLFFQCQQVFSLWESLKMYL